MTKVKICGITNLEDALLSAKFGADALGFNFYEKSPRYISPENARQIIEQLPQEILKVGVFVNEVSDKIARIANVAKLNAIQLHGDETPEFARELKAKTNLEIIKAFRVSPEFQPEDVLQYKVDAVLLDAYSAKERGGTGETFDWEIAKKFKKLKENFSMLYLAGGLSSENVILAIRRIRPFAVDACSLLEIKKGKKNKRKLQEFIKVAKTALREDKKEEKSRNIKDVDIYELLESLENNYEIYLGKKSLVNLNNFLTGFFVAVNWGSINFDQRKYGQFTDKFIDKKLFGKSMYPKSPYNLILEKCDNDDEKAFDLFYELLEEFKEKFEKEDSIIKLLSEINVKDLGNE